MPSVKNELFPSKYIAASNLQNKDVVVTIERVDLVEFDNDNGTKEMKSVVFFKGGAKGLVLNKTNATTIADITGQDDTDNWPGSKVCLFPTMVPWGAKTVEAIRIKRVPEPVSVMSVDRFGRRLPGAATAANPQVDDDMADEIPF